MREEIHHGAFMAQLTRFSTFAQVAVFEEGRNLPVSCVVEERSWSRQQLPAFFGWLFEGLPSSEVGI